MAKKDNVLVTGATGFIGKRLVSALLEKGEFNVRCLVRPGRNIEPLQEILNKNTNHKTEIVTGDLNNGFGLDSALDGVDIVYHLAALKNGTIASSYLNTVVGTRNLLEKINEVTVLKRFVLVSSFAVYGTAKLPRGAVVNETTPLEDNLIKKNDGYTFVKLKQECLAREYAKKFDIPFVVVRPGVVYGPGGDVFSRRIGFNLLGILFNIGRKNFLPLTYVDNCVEAMILAGSVEGVDGEVFNIVDDELVTCNQYLSLYKKKVKKIPSINCPYWLFLILSWIYDKYCIKSNGQIPSVFNSYRTASVWKGNVFENHKQRDRLGWRQTVPTNVGLEKTFQNFKEMGL